MGSSGHTGIFAKVLLVTAFFGGVLFFTQQAGAPRSTSKVDPSFTVPSAEPSAPLVANFVDTIFPESSVVDTPQIQTHIPMPNPVRAIYLTGWSAGNDRMMTRSLGLVERTELNAVVIDIKDASGRLSYQPKDPVLAETGVGTNKIKDLSKVIENLHSKGIYVIGRIAVFQDPFYAARHPEDAFHDTKTGTLWLDYKGLSWLRPDSQAVTDYLVAIARDAYEQGFDEINVDYVRYPSDGPLATLDRGTATTRAQVMENFFSTIDPLVRGKGIVLSADLFGLTMSASDDLGIGQVLERIAPHLDVVAPMVYPSHFAPGAYGIASPAEHPGDIIRISLGHGITKLEAIGIPKEKIRPWLQDFDLGAIYTAGMVRSQIDEAQALGLSSWMLWDPRNLYTEGALLSDSTSAVQ